MVLRAGQGEHPFRVVPPSDLSQLRIQNATITINYIAPGTQNALGDTCLAWPTGSQAAFNYAASIWGSLLNSSVPIKINACWASLEPDVLGHSAPESHHRNFSGAPVANTWYSAALANALSGTDQNDADGLDDDGFNGDVDAEMEIAYNDQGIPWYFGTDGNPSMGQYDFVSVVLHEVCHGLGFAGSMWVYGGQGSWGMEGQPTIYDRFMENGSAQSLLNTSLFPNPSSALAAQLQSNNLYFNGANARAANGGARPKMYAPSTWQPGSSYAHLDEIFNGTANALMTYSLDDGEAIHDPGQVTMGILTDVGWNPMQPAPDLNIITRVVGGLSLEPGDPITFTLTIANSGDKVASHVVVTDTVPSQVLSLKFASTLAITRTGALTYVWNVAPLGVEASGVITIYGQINPGLGSDFSLVNTATLWDPEDRTPDNNTSSVLVGGRRVHFPLVMKRWPPIPDTPVLNAISDPDGDGNYTVSWNAAFMAETYTLEEDDNAAFSSPAVQYAGPDTSWNAAGKAGGTYYYRVAASNSWGDSGWSAVQSVSVRVLSGPTPGFWQSATGDEFYITADRAHVDEFAIYVTVYGCGYYKITNWTQVPISNSHFSFTGSFYANGTFSDATHCSGQDGLGYFYISGCGHVTGGPWSYNATWQYPSGARYFHTAERVSTTATGTPDPALRVEKIGD